MATFTRLEYKRGKSKTAKLWPGQAEAVTRVAIKRYASGMTVGHGDYHIYLKTDPIGAACQVLGWFDDGRVVVALPVGGVGTLGRADVEITSWPPYATAAMIAEWAGLPSITFVVDEEIIPVP